MLAAQHSTAQHSASAVNTSRNKWKHLIDFGLQSDVNSNNATSNLSHTVHHHRVECLHVDQVARRAMTGLLLTNVQLQSMCVQCSGAGVVNAVGDTER